MEAAAQSFGYEFGDVEKPTDEVGMYSLGYAEFVVPLVKAVQELADENNALKSRLQAMEDQMLEMKSMLEVLAEIGDSEWLNKKILTIIKRV